jgi:predicted hotdog family 3-hydroxylacyl-ACP dehydratase
MTLPASSRILDLLPHRPPMVLLDELLDCEPGRARCRVRLRPDSPFMEDGRVRAVVALEYMGQTAAACAGFASRRDGRPPAPGLLLGTRELALAVSHFEAGDELVVEAEHLADGERISSFRCAVRRGGARVAEAVLSVYLPGAAPQEDLEP